MFCEVSLILSKSSYRLTCGQDDCFFYGLILIDCFLRYFARRSLEFQDSVRGVHAANLFDDSRFSGHHFWSRPVFPQVCSEDVVSHAAKVNRFDAPKNGVESKGLPPPRESFTDEALLCHRTGFM